MKVAILSYYSGHVSRGVETFVSEISTRVKPEFKLTVYHESNSRIVMPGKLTNPLAIAWFSLKVLFRLASNPPDILMPLNNNLMSFFSKIFCCLYKSKLILAGFAGIGRIDKFNLWLNPDRFICCTQAQATWARQVNPKAKLSVIPIGVDTVRFSPQGKKLALSLKPPIILCVAGPEKYKRVDLAIQAVKQLNASLLVVGKQPDAINQLGQRLLLKRYLNLQVNFDQLDQVYRSVDLFTLPSASTEAYGVTILEAIASGLPVVVNRDPIRQELVGEAGILVDPTNLQAYVQAIKQGLSTDFYSHQKMQIAKYSWEAVVSSYTQLWQNLVA